ncbi:MAG: 1-acyl-sn-glycerol-3-phosphate acyltransferase [Lachnospiraceae bacterium]|nr:1-acyl-sn-glycerol-3-phosphate acyltransferase [Lachnospiraceae bacterium]
MIRLILCFFVLLIAFVLTVVAFPLSRLIRLINRRAGDLFSLRFVTTTFRALLFVGGVHVEFIGKEHLPKKGEAVVYISNHLGVFDIVALYPEFPDLTGFVAKKEILSWPLIGWWLKAVNSLPLDRKDPRSGFRTIFKAADYVEKEGISMVIFPEGTRSRKDGDVLPFHKGSFKLATTPKARLIPVAITNTSAVFEDHLPFIRSQKVVIEFCEPIETADLTREEEKDLPVKVHDIIEERVRANHPAVNK